MFFCFFVLLVLLCSADNGEEFLPNRFVKSCAWAGSYKSLAHYCTRGWCRLEMLLGQTEPLPQDGFMFNFLVPKKKKVSLLVFGFCLLPLSSLSYGVCMYMYYITSESFLFRGPIDICGCRLSPFVCVL